MHFHQCNINLVCLKPYRAICMVPLTNNIVDMLTKYRDKYWTGVFCQNVGQSVLYQHEYPYYS